MELNAICKSYHGAPAGMSPLPFGPLGPGTAHLCVDMQNVFLEATPCHVPWLARILPAVTEIARRKVAATILTRFVPPSSAHEARVRGSAITSAGRSSPRDRIDPHLLALAPGLAELAPPAEVFDKPVYSPFSGTRFDALLPQRGIDSLVVTGAETDLCVLATVLGAIDRAAIARSS